MALFIRQSEERSELQERLAAELREKAKAKAAADGKTDGVTDSAYLKDTKTTTSLAGVWIALILIAVGILIFFIVTSGN